MMTNSTLALANKIDNEPAVPPAAVAAGSPREAAEGWQSVRAVQKPTSPLTILARAVEHVDWSGVMQSWTVRLLSLAAGILFWHLACAYNLDFFIRFNNVPSPFAVLSAFIGHVQDSKFYVHILVSMQRILISFGLATAIGIVVGVLMGRSKIARDMVTPYIEVLRPIPAVAWIPLAILMWPTEESSIIYITFLGALFPIILNTVHGVEQTPEVLVRAAQTLGASRMQIFWNVTLPAALPSIATGLAIGMGVSWFSLLAGEIISGQYGIGYFTWNAYSLINYADIVVGMLVIGGLGTLSTLAVRKITQPLLSWQTRSR
jgi:NitT/TauT family transport system permease protein